ncbi:hypothetical protein [Microbacterium alcoholitolerans]|uniref:hypothetical protein n=1 Tax=unclassified Microbacterium TaxID=2609290 RepID=UPI003D16B6E6
MTNTLAMFFVPIGMAGAALAIACALVAAFAVARGAAGLAGGAIGVWIVGALLSLAASFATEWMPLLVALSALAAGLALGGVIRMLVLTTRAKPVTAQVKVSSQNASAATPHVSQTAASSPAAPASSARTHTSSVKTSSTPVAA